MCVQASEQADRQSRPARPARARWIAAASLLAFVVAGCAEPEPEPEPELPDPPAVEQIERDLVGQRFVFFEDADGERVWTIEEPEIVRVAVVGQQVTEDSLRSRSRISVVLRADTRTIGGDLLVTHRRVGPNWQIESTSRVGPSFTAADESATLYAVEALVDSTGETRQLFAEPIAVIDRGRWHAPLAAFEAGIRRHLDSLYWNDSMRVAAEDALVARIADAHAPRGRTLRLLARGQAPMRARVDSAQVLVDGCRSVGGYVRSPGGTAREATLATTSSVMGGAVAPGRPLTTAETRTLEFVARERLAGAGGDPSRLRSRGALAADLDGDGVDELVGAFASGDVASGEPGGVSVALAVRPTPAGADVVVLRVPEDGYAALTLLGVVDVDGDRAAEVVFEESGYEAYRFLVVTHRAGRYTNAFRGGGGGC